MSKESTNKPQVTLDVIMAKITDIHADVKTIVDRSNVIDDDPVLSVNEVCAVLHICDRQLRVYRKNQELVGFMLDRRRLYRHSEVQAFLKTREAAWLKKQKAIQQEETNK